MVVIDRAMEWRMGPGERFEEENLNSRFVVDKSTYYLYSEYVEPKKLIPQRQKPYLFHTFQKQLGSS